MDDSGGAESNFNQMVLNTNALRPPCDARRVRRGMQVRDKEAERAAAVEAKAQAEARLEACEVELRGEGPEAARLTASIHHLEYQLTQVTPSISAPSVRCLWLCVGASALTLGGPTPCSSPRRGGGRLELFLAKTGVSLAAAFIVCHQSEPSAPHRLKNQSGVGVGPPRTD
jgi:hypothetical protein